MFWSSLPDIYTFHHFAIDGNSGKDVISLSEVQDDFLGVRDIKGEVIFSEPVFLQAVLLSWQVSLTTAVSSPNFTMVLEAYFDI